MLFWKGVNIIAIYRFIRVDLWKDSKVCEKMSPREKLLFVYLLTNPYTTQIGIYTITVKQIAFDLGFTKPFVKSTLIKFQEEYKILRYNEETDEIAIAKWGKYNLYRLGKPMEACIEKELKCVKELSLVEYVLSGIESERAREIYIRFLESKTLENTTNNSYVTCGLQGEKEKENKKQNEKENIKVINIGEKYNGKLIREAKAKVGEYDERPSEDMLRYAREL